MREETFDLIRTLTELQGTSGYEKAVRNYLKKEMEPLVDKLEVTGLGNIFGIKNHSEADAPRLMIAAHLDEVGFMVTSIEDNGLFKVIPLGGWNPYVVSGQRYTLQTKKGDYPCISSSISPHLLRGQSQKPLKIEDILFDAGFMCRQEAEEFGVQVGDTIVPQADTVMTVNQKNIISKAWDNRYGCAVVVEVLRDIQKETLTSTLIAGATVQEEVGARGAQGALYHYDPDIFLALDCSAADDIYGQANAMGKLGEGCLIRVQDPSLIVNKGLREYLFDIAETHNIPYQAFFSKGGTDASAAITTRSGIISGVVGVPARYIHGHQGLFNVSDYEAAKELVKQFVINFDKTTLDTIQQS